MLRILGYLEGAACVPRLGSHTSIYLFWNEKILRHLVTAQVETFTTVCSYKYPILRILYTTIILSFSLFILIRLRSTHDGNDSSPQNMYFSCWIINLRNTLQHRGSVVFCMTRLYSWMYYQHHPSFGYSKIV